MELIRWYAIVPVSVASFFTGLVMALRTKWKLLRHYWVVFSLALTVFATVILLLHMPTVSATTDLAKRADAATLRALGGDLLHPGVGLVVLLLINTLNVFKPRGLTPYGARVEQRGVPSEQSCDNVPETRAKGD